MIISARALAVVSLARVARHEVPKTRVCLLVLKLHLSSSAVYHLQISARLSFCCFVQNRFLSRNLNEALV